MIEKSTLKSEQDFVLLFPELEKSGIETKGLTSPIFYPVIIVYIGTYNPIGKEHLEYEYIYSSDFKDE